MCIIAIKKAHMPMFDDDTIKTMFENNPDGAGYMYVNDGKVIIHKGFMDAEELTKSLNDNDLDDKNVILHFRIGTSGLKNGLNAHPYPVYDDNALDCITDLAMVHNGVLSGFTPSFSEPINDTQNFIHKVLRNLDKDFINNKDKKFLISKLIGTNKLAFLDSHDNITLIGEFVEDGGYVYSNTSYKPKKMTNISNFFGRYHYRPLSMFDDYEEDDKSISHKVMSFDSEREMMNFINRIPRIYKVDDDLYEDMDGNIYDLDKDACLIYIN